MCYGWHDVYSEPHVATRGENLDTISVKDMIKCTLLTGLGITMRTSGYNWWITLSSFANAVCKALNNCAENVEKIVHEENATFVRTK